MGESLKLANAAATEALGRSLVNALPEVPAGWCVLLQGALGAGKSTLARAMLRTLGHEGPVPSPTYTLIEPYEFGKFTVYHIDLYRIQSDDELDFLGFSELQDGLRLIEWPERAALAAAAADLRVELSYAGQGREARIVGLSRRGHRISERLAASLSEISS
ncbi:MAG: tRNA (adenosine(37)-N6)-threonylcarbamoyltransferase complex ATPase subunit type 1 TsaE [Woeseiaceae bacterium]|nr:tRNA (adenosine(37)-N6)-threonylcarbamoyltransferase complex ATPase subunit type 1 TsaE [Woeseiaceae bacterium]